MDIHRHHVSGFFAQRKDAEATLAILVARGLAREQLQIFDTNLQPAPPAASTPHQAPPVISALPEPRRVPSGPFPQSIASERIARSTRPTPLNGNRLAAYPSGKGSACKALIPRFESGCRLHFSKSLSNRSEVSSRVPTGPRPPDPVRSGLLRFRSRRSSGAR